MDNHLFDVNFHHQKEMMISDDISISTSFQSNIYICICKSKRGFLNINNNTHTSSFSYKVASQDTFLWINVTLCQNFALADNAKASGCCNSSRGHLKSLSLLLTFKSNAKALLC